MNDIDNLIVQTAEAGLRLQTDEGAMPSGHNGPHRHRMTPARNTGHWMITFLHAYQLSGDARFQQAARKGLDLLISQRLRPLQGAFWHRCHNGKNSFNGLIGQSWSMEALYYGWKILGEEKYRTVALEVFSQHVYHRDLGLWYQLDLDGSACNIEMTLNQQIWLAAIGAKLAGKDDSITVDLVQDFLSRLADKILLRPHGLFPVAVLRKPGIVAKTRRLVKELIYGGHDIRRRIEYGYHIFTLCGLAQIFEVLPNHEFWSTTLFRKALNLPFSPGFWAKLLQSPYGFPYNVPGFELPYVYSTFHRFVSQPDAAIKCYQYLQHQRDQHYNSKTDLLELNSDDPDTLAARFYEICRIPRSFFSQLNG